MSLSKRPAMVSQCVRKHFAHCQTRFSKQRCGRGDRVRYPRRRSQAEERLRTYGRYPTCDQRTIAESLMESCMWSLAKAVRHIVPAQVKEARSS